MGSATVSKFYRLYMFPGVYHCGDGTGPSSFELLSSLIAWTENDTTPGAITASSASTSQSSGGPSGGQFSGGPSGGSASSGAGKLPKLGSGSGKGSGRNCGTWAAAPARPPAAGCRQRVVAD
jgi:hypothetical protein